MDEVRYCEKCGYAGHVLFSKKCKNCKIKMKILPEEFKQKYNIFNDSWLQIGAQINGFSNNTIIGTINEELALREEMIARINNFVMNELANSSLFSLKIFSPIAIEFKNWQSFIKIRLVNGKTKILHGCKKKKIKKTVFLNVLYADHLI